MLLGLGAASLLVVVTAMPVQAAGLLFGDAPDQSVIVNAVNVICKQRFDAQTQGEVEDGCSHVINSIQSRRGSPPRKRGGEHEPLKPPCIRASPSRSRAPLIL